MEKYRRSFLHQYLSEISVGFHEKKLYFICAACIGFYICNGMFGTLYSYHAGQVDNVKVSIGDCIIYLFRGMKPYNPIDKQPFDVPFQYMVLGIMLILIVGNYAINDLHGFGRLKLILSQSKFQWWIGKCIWNLVSVLMYVASLIIGILVSCLFHMSYIDTSGFRNILCIHRSVIMSFTTTNNAAEDMQSIEGFPFLGRIVIVILLTLFALSLLQMILSFAVNATVSAITVISIYIFSAFYMNKFLIGNYVMLCRMDVFVSEGIYYHDVIITTLMTIGMSFIIGYFIFRTKDIL